MELSVNQKSVLKVLKDTYKKDTVTRSEINDLVKKGKIKNPSWLKSDKFKVDRGVYTLNINDVSGDVAEVESVDTKISDESKAAYVVSSLTDNVVPAKDKDFVNFGNFADEADKFLKESSNIVNYLVKEFEMKKNAKLHALSLIHI